jgi:hypothetical protein
LRHTLWWIGLAVIGPWEHDGFQAAACRGGDKQIQIGKLEHFDDSYWFTQFALWWRCLHCLQPSKVVGVSLCSLLSGSPCLKSVNLWSPLDNRLFERAGCGDKYLCPLVGFLAPLTNAEKGKRPHFSHLLCQTWQLKYLWTNEQFFSNVSVFFCTPRQSMSDAPTRKRRRPALSCVECRRRKIKCDRRMPCSSSQYMQLKSPTCIYPETHSTAVNRRNVAKVSLIPLLANDHLARAGRPARPQELRSIRAR